jgi:WD40 repeat protein
MKHSLFALLVLLLIIIFLIPSSAQDSVATLLWRKAGHPCDINVLAYSGNGRILAVGDHCGVITLWDTESGSFLARINKNNRAIWAIALNRDGSLLATGGVDDTVTLWDVRTAGELRSFEMAATVFALAWSPDERSLAVGNDHRKGSDRGTITLIELATGKTAHVFESSMSEDIRAIRFSPNGKYLAGLNGQRQVEVWHLSSFKRIYTCPALSFDILPDSKTLVTAGYSGIDLHDLEGAHAERTMLKENLGGVRLVRSLRQGSAILSVDRPIALVINASSGAIVRSIPLGKRRSTNAIAALSPDEATMAVAEGNEVTLWDIRTGAFLKTLTGNTFPPDAIEWTPDGSTIVCTDPGNRIRYYEARSGRERESISIGSQTRGFTFAMDAGGTAIAVEMADGKGVELHSFPAGELLREFHVSDRLWHVALSRDSRLLAVALEKYGSGDAVMVWNTSTGSPVLTTSKKYQAFMSVALSPDNTRFAARTSNREIYLFDIGSGLPLFSVHDSSNETSPIVFSADGRCVVSIAGNEVKFSQIPSAGTIHSAIKFVNWVRAVCLSSDDSLLVAADDKKVIHVVLIESGRTLFEIQTPEFVTSLALSRDKKLLAAGLWDCSVCVWELP